MDLLKKFILEKGDLQKRDLIQSPFTMLHPEGIRGVFSPKEIDEILVLTNKLLAA
jgi:type I restriction enzyme R subunit